MGIVEVWQHVPFEGPAFIREWAETRGHSVNIRRVWEGPPPLPEPDTRLLVVMGGPMGVHDTAECPWLRDEKHGLKAAIDAGLPVLGVCLGAQLIADVLGAVVTRNTHREIGWFDIVRDDAIAGTWLGPLWPARLKVLHWHGDTFAIPRGAVRMASSEACANQGFLYGDRVIGLQCHLETTAPWLERLATHCAHELDGSTFVQSPAALRAGLANAAAMQDVLRQVLERLVNLAGASHERA